MCASRQNKQCHSCNLCVRVCVHNTSHRLWGQITQKTFTHTLHNTAQHRLRPDLSWGNKAKDFPPVSSRGYLARERERKRERGLKGCTSAWRTHLFNSFSYISAIFFSIMCRHVPATCSPICPVPFSDCLHCFLFFFCIFVFLFKELSFSVPQLGLLALRFSLPRWQSQRVSQEQHRKKGKYL